MNTAVVLAGSGQPVPLFDRTVLEWVLEDLADLARLQRVFVVTGPDKAPYSALAPVLERKLDTQVNLIPLPETVGTAGALRELASRLEGDVVVLEGNARLETDVTSFVNAHRQSRMPVSMAVVEVDDVTRFRGGLRLRKDRVTAIEGPAEGPGWVCGGLYCVEAEWLARIPRGAFSFLEDVLPRWLERPQVVAYARTGYFARLDSSEGLLAYARDLLSGRAEGLVDDEVEGADLRWLGKGANVSPEARLEGTVVIGDNAQVEAGAFLKDCIIGPGCTVASGTELRDCVLGAG